MMASILAFFTASCHRRPSPPVPPPASTGAASALFNSGEEAFDQGSYAEAARSYAAYLQANIPDNQDRAYFRLGLAMALVSSDARDLKQARLHFQHLLAQFPRSPYRAPAEIILNLEAEIERLSDNLEKQESKIKVLTEELQRLKAIDLQRQPSRPDK